MRSILCALTVLSLAGSANAAYFSFASDVNAANWTFTGQGNTVSAVNAPGATYTLLVNDDNGGNTLAYNVTLSASMTLANGTAVQRGLNRVAYDYDITSAIVSFNDAVTGLPLLTASFADGLLSALGNGTVGPGGVANAAWSSTSGIQVSDGAGAITYNWFGGDLPSYSLFSGSGSVGPDDLGFTLTVINTDGRRPLPANAPRGVGLDSQTLFPSTTWFSEGSYSGSAYFVPTPGAAALLGLGVLAAARRKR